MMFSRRRWPRAHRGIAALALTCLNACHDSSPVAPPSAAPEPPATAATKPTPTEHAELGPHQSPVTLRLRGPEQVIAGQDIELIAEVNQRVGSQAQVSLNLQLPDGVRLVSGENGELLPSGNGTLTRRFVVHVERVPQSDIEAVASTQSTAFGARAQSAYRFGRPEPRFLAPERSERPLTVGGKNVGRPIQLHPSP